MGQALRPRDPEAPGPLERVLGVVSDVRRGEAPTAFLLLSAIFVLLFAYYVLKVVREPLVLASAMRDLEVLAAAPWVPGWLHDVLLDKEGGAKLKAVAATCQAIVLIAFVPLYGWIAARVSRIRLILSVTLFFLACVELFFVLRLLGVPLLGFFFYVWVGIFGYSMIATFWSFGNDIYTKEQGERLFPFIAVGQAAGAPAGSKLSGELLDALEGAHLDVDPAYLLMQLPAVLLAVYLGLLALAHRRENSRVERGKSTSLLDAARAGGSFMTVLRSPYVRLIAMLILVLNVVNTTGELILSEHVVTTAESRAQASSISVGVWIGHFYGDFYFFVNIATLALQLFVVSRLVRRLGLKGVLLVLPIVALGSYSLFALGLALAVLRWAKTAENATDYSIMNTGKALLWLPTSREEKYQGKQAVDTFFVRIGDLVAASIFLVATTLFQFGMQALALINLCFVALWLGLTFLVLRAHDRRVAENDQLRTATR